MKKALGILLLIVAFLHFKPALNLFSLETVISVTLPDEKNGEINDVGMGEEAGVEEFEIEKELFGFHTAPGSPSCTNFINTFQRHFAGIPTPPPDWI